MCCVFVLFHSQIVFMIYVRVYLSLSQLCVVDASPPCGGSFYFRTTLKSASTIHMECM